MKKLVTLLGAASVALAFSTSAHAADVVVMKFRADDCSTCGMIEAQVDTALAMVGTDSVKEITVDVSNAALWEKGAHESFDADVVPVFNKYVGLTGFAAVVDARTQRTIGCVNENYDASQVAALIKKAAGMAQTSQASTRVESFQCPPAHNKLP